MHPTSLRLSGFWKFDTYHCGRGVATPQAMLRRQAGSGPLNFTFLKVRLSELAVSALGTQQLFDKSQSGDSEAYSYLAESEPQACATRLSFPYRDCLRYPIRLFFIGTMAQGHVVRVQMLFPDSLQEGIAGQCDADDVGVGQQGQGEEAQAQGLGLRSFQGQGAEHDIGEESEELGGQPALGERVLPAQPGHGQGAAEQQGVDDVRQDPAQPVLQQR